MKKEEKKKEEVGFFFLALGLAASVGYYLYMRRKSTETPRILMKIPDDIAEEGGPYECTINVNNTTDKRIEKIEVSLSVEGQEILFISSALECDPKTKVNFIFEFVPHAAGRAVMTAVIKDAWNNVLDTATWDFVVLQGWWKEPIRAELVMAESWSS